MSILHTSSIFEMIEEKKAQCHQFRCCPFHQTLAHRGLSQGCTNMNGPEKPRVHTLFHSSGLGTTGTMATRMGTPWLEISNHLVWRASFSTLRHVRHWAHQPPESPRKAPIWGKVLDAHVDNGWVLNAPATMFEYAPTFFSMPWSLQCNTKKCRVIPQISCLARALYSL